MRALVAECKLPDKPSRLGEVVEMAGTIGYHVVSTVVQKRNSVHHSYTIGSGKLKEITKLVEEREVEVVIFANTLSSSHVFKIQRRIENDVKVIDRNLLILELFERRAMTVEAKLQIQLARLRYTFSWGREYIKLKGILGEQVGWSGPGDYPFKEYEKAARKRISRIKEKIEEIRFKKDLLRVRRRELGYPIVALAGYTQSGKTTLFNRLTEEDKIVGLGPFTTLSTFARRVDFIGGKPFILVDSIGFIEDMHPIILDAFTATMKEISDADLILLFFDVSDDIKNLKRHIHSSDAILRRINVQGRILVCLNKMELVEEDHLKSVEEIVSQQLTGLPIIPISAKTGANVEPLMKEIHNILNVTSPLLP
jgi:GTP-binding protein HflX